MKKSKVRTGMMLGKYRISRRIARGGFADVFAALDSIEGIPAALKIPHVDKFDQPAMAYFRKEVRLAGKLEHPGILPLKNADFINGHFVIASPLGESTLAERLQSRMTTAQVLDYAEQILSALAHAHERGIIHCDIKPENIILFPGNRLRLTDFGIARFANHTLPASGSGTLGYMAPEQAMGKPSPRSDVFSMGLLIYLMLTGHLPEWPFEWPPPNYERLRRNMDKNAAEFLRKALNLNPRLRFENARTMLAAFQRVKRGALRLTKRRARSRARANGDTNRDWRIIRDKEYLRRFGKPLGAHAPCKKCGGPVAEVMKCCPWCGNEPVKFSGAAVFPRNCPRCKRGVKSEWRYCPWCYGGAIGPPDARRYSDRRYTNKCSAAGCRGQLMPFMRYCPWCRAKVKRKWKIAEGDARCGKCGWGTAAGYWSKCAWCAAKLPTRK